MEINDTLLEQITTMGTLAYDFDKIVNVLDISDEESFREQFEDLNSKIRKAYQKGFDKSDYIIDQKLYDLAKSGDIKAIEKYESRKSQKQNIEQKTPAKQDKQFHELDPKLEYLTNMSPLEMLYECGRLGFPPIHAIRLLRGNVSSNCLTETSSALEISDSPEMQSYYDGTAMGETELASTLRQNAIDGKKDAYKSMNTEENKRVINDSIHKNFGIGEN